jgi:hypothetical protein
MTREKKSILDEARERVAAEQQSEPIKPPPRRGDRCSQPFAEKVIRLDPATEYAPFPVERLPPVIADYVAAAASALGADAGMLGPIGLAVAAGMIGATRAIRLKRGWLERPILWVGVVQDSGSMKTPAFGAMMRIVWKIANELRKDHQREMAAWKKAKKEGSVEDPPESSKTILTSDATIESIAEILQRNPRGSLLGRDELSGWLRSFGKYSARGASPDTSNWLELHQGGTVIVHRKTGENRQLFVKNACLSICGTIQPGILRSCMTNDHRESGLSARLLLSSPPERKKTWSEIEIDPDTEERYENLIRCLSSLDFADSDCNPVIIPLTPEAKRQWLAFFDEWAERQFGADGETKSRLAKLEAAAARFALVDHVVRSCIDPNDRFEGVRGESMENGIALAKWFAAEAERIDRTMGESDSERDMRRLIDWLRRQPGHKATVKRLQQSNARRYPTSEDARHSLNSVAISGLGVWTKEQTKTPGRFVDVLTLHPIRPSDDSDDSTISHSDTPSDDSPTLSDDSKSPTRFSEGFRESSESSDGLMGCRGRNGRVENKPSPNPSSGESSDDLREAEEELRQEREAILDAERIGSI